MNLPMALIRKFGKEKITRYMYVRESQSYILIRLNTHRFDPQRSKDFDKWLLEEPELKDMNGGHSVVCYLLKKNQRSLFE